MYLDLEGKTWIQVRDANVFVRQLFDRHYSRHFYKDGRKPKKFIGPGQYMALITPKADACFIWRKFISKDGQRGVNCMLFRNESKFLSSMLIDEACKLAWKRWPNERLYTYVNPRKIRSINPGACFKKVGWRTCGVTKKNKLIILERIPEDVNNARTK